MFQKNLDKEIPLSKKQKFSKNNFPPDLGEIQVTILVETEIRPTEDKKFVLRSLTNIFPDIEFIKQGDRYSGRSNKIKSMNYFSHRLLEQEILDAARRVILKRINNSNEKNFIEFMVNKQTAKINKIVFCEKDEAPLGPIIIKILSPDLRKIIDSYFPKYEWFKQ